MFCRPPPRKWDTDKSGGRVTISGETEYQKALRLGLSEGTDRVLAARSEASLREAAVALDSSVTASKTAANKARQILSTAQTAHGSLSENDPLRGVTASAVQASIDLGNAQDAVVQAHEAVRKIRPTPPASRQEYERDAAEAAQRLTEAAGKAQAADRQFDSAQQALQKATETENGKYRDSINELLKARKAFNEARQKAEADESLKKDADEQLGKYLDATTKAITAQSLLEDMGQLEEKFGHIDGGLEKTKEKISEALDKTMLGFYVTGKITKAMDGLCDKVSACSGRVVPPQGAGNGRKVEAGSSR